jgi:hypothetical protein
MRIIDCIPRESSVFFTLEKNDFIRSGSRHKPIRRHSAVAIPELEFEGIYGAIDGITTRVVIFIDADAEMV